jgi:hypothetical protein
MIPKVTLSLLSAHYSTTVHKNIQSFFSDGVGSLLAATSSMLCIYVYFLIKIKITVWRTGFLLV